MNCDYYILYIRDGNVMDLAYVVCHLSYETAESETARLNASAEPGVVYHFGPYIDGRTAESAYLIASHPQMKGALKDIASTLRDALNATAGQGGSDGEE